MKRNHWKIVLCSGILASVLAFSGCGSEKKEETKIETETKAEPAEDTEAEAAEDAVEETEEVAQEEDSSVLPGMFTDMKELAESEEIQSQLEGLIKTYADQGLNIRVFGEGNVFTYEYTYADQEYSDELKAGLESAMANQKDTFTGIATQFKSAVAVDDPVVRVTYLDKNGIEIYSVDFHAE